MTKYILYNTATNMLFSKFENNKPIWTKNLDDIFITDKYDLAMSYFEFIYDYCPVQVFSVEAV